MRKYLSNRLSIRLSLLIALAAVTLGLTILWSQVGGDFTPLKTGREFTQTSVGNAYHLFDMGVADINDDQWLDIYTLNHSARQRVLINNTHGEFTDQLLALGLNQNSKFPGAGPSDIMPAIQAAGLYIYWDKSQLVVRSHNLASASGQIRLPDSVVVKTRGAFDTSTNKHEGRRVLDFTAQGEGQLTIASTVFFFTPAFKLDPDLPLSQIYIGSERVQPQSYEFAVSPGRDRHAMAWADLNRDRQTDVFIARGGGVGQLKPDPVRNNDELLLKTRLTFEDQTLDSGVLKEACPGRYLGLVDFDNDSQLDIYTGCGRDSPPRQFYPNQLHRQNNQGQFTNVATERGLDIPAAGPFMWLDADQDQDMDLLFFDEDKISLYTNKDGKFQPQSIGEHLGEIRQLTTADYDQDGDLDVFVASKIGNILLTNRNGLYEITSPQSIGLPPQSIAANWVDYDNDGLTDLHVFPSGLYRQQVDHRFEATRLLKSNDSEVNEVFCSWFDADNDGRRDLLMAIQAPSPIWQRLQSKIANLFQKQERIFTFPEWQMLLYRNIRANDHWLQVQLTGPAGNRPAIGSRIEIETSDGVQLQQVGQADGSNRSQGHYRMYFGLGQLKTINTLKIFWANGRLQEIKHPPTDQLIIQ
ncbi:MAG: CRTAC1 family protein [Cyanobacteria bacterium P01_D01_bin.44]